MASKSEKTYVLWWIVGCAAVITIFHLVWAKYLFMNYKESPLFTWVDVCLFIAFGGSSILAYIGADNPNEDYWRKVFIWITVASSIWAAAWSTGLMNNISEGIK
jgi:hypothetical protein